MKVLIVAPRVPWPPLDGGRVAINAIALGLRDAGAEVEMIAEAMALGVPVVSTTRGADGLGVAHDRELAIADEADDFADALVRVEGDFPLRVRLASAARALVDRELDRETLGGVLLEFYAELRGGGSLLGRCATIAPT